MTLWNQLFGSPAIDQVFSDRNTVQRMLDVEAALAQAGAQLGIIPRTAAPLIRAHCRVDELDLATLAASAAQSGNLAIPLVLQLTANVSAAHPEAAPYVHWGATSQDVIDTGLVLQVRDALRLIAAGVTRLEHATLQLAERYRASPTVARTWMQHAAPTSLGLMFAGWSDALRRHAGRIETVLQTDLVLQLGGAAGTLAGFGGRGIEVAALLGAELGLPVPAMPWHAHRDRLAAVATTLAMLVGTLGKIARDVALAGQTEVGELAEPRAPGKGGSSTMPHKQNPVGAAVVLAAAVRAPALASSILTGMVQEQERGLGGWQAEWESVPELVRVTGGAVHQLVAVVEGLSVDADRARANLDATHGLVYTEALSRALASKVGRTVAAALVAEASRRVRESGRPLRDIVSSDTEIARHLDARDLARIFEPASQVDAAAQLVDRVLEQARSSPDARHHA
jgi:3-carboxy-cis,cis-muconate cycloisomerase